jgi:hypothetical protein
MSFLIIICDFQEFWNITDDVHKKVVLRCMGERWRSWKSRLVSKYIVRADPLKPANPCDMYNITSAQWQEFCLQKATDEFKVLCS